MSKRLSTVVEHDEEHDDGRNRSAHSASRSSLKKQPGAAKSPSNRHLPSLVSNHGSGPNSRATSPANSVADSARSSSKLKVKLPPVKQGLSAAGKELLTRMREEHLEIGEIEDMLHDGQYRKAVNDRDEMFGWTPLHFMANRGHTHLTEVLLKEKAHPDVACNLGNTPLHLAARGNHLHVVSMLVARHAALDCQNHNGWTALMCGAMAGHGDVLPSLLSGRADAEVLDNQGRNASMWAARHGHGNILETLLAQVPNLDLCDVDGLTVVDHAQEHRDLRRAVRKLFKSSRLLLQAARYDNLEAVVEALNDGAVVNARDSEGGSAIGWASTNGSDQMVSLLLQFHADPNLATWRPSWALGSDGFGEFHDDGTSMTEAIRAILRNQSRLLNAARDNDWEDALDALNTAVAINNKDEMYQRTAFMWAAIHGAADAIQKIVEMHGDVEMRDSVGWTAVHYAVHQGQAEALSALHYVRANFNAKTWEGDSAQHLAAKSGNWRMLYLLQAAKVDMETVNNQGLTCLQVAITSQQPLAVSTLLALKCDPQIKDHRGRDTFHIAVVNGNTEIVHLLLEPLHVPKLEGCGPGHQRKRSICSSSRPRSRASNVAQKRKSIRPLAGKPHSNDKDAHSHGSESQEGKQHAKHQRSSKKDDGHDEDAHSQTKAAHQDQNKLSRAKNKRGTILQKKKGHREKDEHEHHDHTSEKHGQLEETENHADVDEQRHHKQRPRSRDLRPHSRDRDVHQDEVEQEYEESFHGSDTHSMCASGPRRSIAHSVTSASSSKLGKRRQSRAPGQTSNESKSEAKTAESRTMSSLMLSAMVLCEGLPDQCQSPLVARSALAAKDGDGQNALALALHFHHSMLVPILIEQKADVNAMDASGATMLMCAAAWGERSVVNNILSARALVLTKDSKGQQAVHYAANSAVRRTLELILMKDEVERRLASMPTQKRSSVASSKSMPALHANKRNSVGASNTSATIYRLRLESLPVMLPADMLESHIRAMLKRHGNFDPMNMSVAVDPITQKPQGHAYLDFSDPNKVESLIQVGGDIFFGSDDAQGLFASAVMIAKEPTILSADDLN